MLAPDGRCKSLDAGADGYSRGEACVTMGVTLIPDTDSARLTASDAVIAGSAINQDGRSSSLTAPNGPSQQRVIRLGLQDALLLASEMQSLEMHGTGTALGDPIEIGAAAAVLLGGPSRAAPLELSAAKNQLGHGEPAAGTVGVCRALNRLSESFQIGLLHLVAVNPYIVTTLEQPSFDKVAMPRQLSTAPYGGAVGISGFAFQGTNAHVVMHRQVISLSHQLNWVLFIRRLRSRL